jgi:DNA-binding transcriptional LysR family regulator
LVEGDATTLPAGLNVQLFAYDELVLVVAPTHVWGKLSLVQPQALSEGTLLLREQGSAIREFVEQGLLQYDVQVHPLFTLTDNEAIKQMVISGVGAAIVSSLSVQRELANGDLVQVPIAGIELRPQLSLIQRVDKQLSRAAQTFSTFLRPPLDLKSDLHHVGVIDE